MHKTECVPASELDWMKTALHDLCQPLTALECGLFLGTMSADGVGAPTAEEMMSTIRAAQRQCERATAQVRAMRERMQQEL